MAYSAIFWGVGTYLLTAFLKARSPEEYESMRLAGWPKIVLDVARFFAVVGVDGAKLNDALKDVRLASQKQIVNEYVNSLPEDLRATLPPLATMRRIDSKEFLSVNKLPEKKL